MPVVNLSVTRLRRMLPTVALDRIIESLPYIGLDIEGTEGDTIRVEYNPNRPDFSSDYGIARGLKGLLGIQTGLPAIRTERRVGFSIVVDQKVASQRPYIAGVVGTSGSLDEETIKQLIGMQEDLHNGLGRSRRKVSIGIHNLDAVKFPLKYTAVERGYSFVPLGETSPKTIGEVISGTPTGKEFGHIVSQFNNKYPILLDSQGETVSLPPIVNSNHTRVDTSVKNLFVEVTGTDKRAVFNALSVIAVTLFDAGFKIMTVRVHKGRKYFDAPELAIRKIRITPQYVNSLLGTDLSIKEIKKCLEKSRLGATVSKHQIICYIPEYRTDISSGIDLVEEVAIGYGVNQLSPSLPSSLAAGDLSLLSRQMDAVRTSLIGLGLLETVGFSLTTKNLQYSPFGLEVPKESLSVASSKSAEHEILRSSLVPTLLQALSRNVHEEYPQRIFEIGKIFGDIDHTEAWAVAAVAAHVDASFSESVSIALAMLRSTFGLGFSARPIEHYYYIPGRAAEIVVNGRPIGTIGEVTPRALDWLKLRTPVSAFEMNLSKLLEHESLSQTRKEI